MWVCSEAIGDIFGKSCALTLGLWPVCDVAANDVVQFPCMAGARVMPEAVGKRSRGQHLGLWLSLPHESHVSSKISQTRWKR